MRARPPGLHVHAQLEPLAQIRDEAAVAQRRDGRRLLGLAVAPQRALDPGPLLLDEGLHLRGATCALGRTTSTPSASTTMRAWRAREERRTR